MSDRGENSKAHTKQREWNKNSVSGRKRRLLEKQGRFCAFGHKDSVPLLWSGCLMSAGSSLPAAVSSHFFLLVSNPFLSPSCLIFLPHCL